MATLKYVKGAPVPSSRGYRLFEKMADGTYEKLDEKTTRQNFVYAGGISKDGTHAPPSEIFSTVGQGEKINVTPVAKFTVSGPQYYIRIKGKMNLDTNYGTSSGVPFQGTLYLDEPDPVDFGYNDLNPLFIKDGSVYFNNIIKPIKIFDLGDDPSLIVHAVGITQSDPDAVPTVYYADLKYRRTDFIEIDALTNDLLDDNNKRVCVGRFAAPSSEAPVYKIAFYSEMDYSTCVKAMTYEQIKLYFGVAEKDFLTAEEVKALSTAGVSNAKYVVFSSAKAGGDDKVSVGIYFPLYPGVYDGKLDDMLPHTLVVQAIGDNITFRDSDYSNEETYTLELD